MDKLKIFTFSFIEINRIITEVLKSNIDAFYLGKHILKIQQHNSDGNFKKDNIFILNISGIIDVISNELQSSDLKDFCLLEKVIQLLSKDNKCSKEDIIGEINDFLNQKKKRLSSSDWKIRNNKRFLSEYLKSTERVQKELKSKNKQIKDNITNQEQLVELNEEIRLLKEKEKRLRDDIKGVSKSLKENPSLEQINQFENQHDAFINKIHEEWSYLKLISQALSPYNERETYNDYFPSILKNADREKYFDKIDFNIAKNSLVSFLTNPIPKPKIFNIYKGKRYNYKWAEIIEIDEQKDFDSNKQNDIDREVIYTDILAPLFFSLQQSIGQNNHLTSQDGCIYLNIGNGIFAKIIIRENSNKNYPLIALMKYGNNITYTRAIFKGYTSSGFILYYGIYLITKEYVFEIFFDADATMLCNSNIQQAQSISDSALMIQNEEDEE